MTIGTAKIKSDSPLHIKGSLAYLGYLQAISEANELETNDHLWIHDDHLKKAKKLFSDLISPIDLARLNTAYLESTGDGWYSLSTGHISHLI